MSYTTTQIKTEVRALLGEEDTSGYYSQAFLLKQINISIKSRIIPDLFAVSKNILMKELIANKTLQPMIVTDERYDYFDFGALYKWVELDYDGQTGNFTVGLILTGATSDAVGEIVEDDDQGNAGTLILKTVNGTFINNEAITDSSTGAAVVNLAPTSYADTIVYTPSLRAWIDKIRVKFFDIDKIFRYEDDDYAYFRPQALGAIVGNQIRIYGVDAYKWQKVTYDNLAGDPFTVGETVEGATSKATGVVITDADPILTLKDISGVFVNDEEIEGATSGSKADVDGAPINCALDFEFIEMPNYTTGQTVALSDHVIEALLIPILCFESLRREPEMPKAKTDAFKLDYTEALKVIAGTYGYLTGPEPLPIERIGKALGG